MHLLPGFLIHLHFCPGIAHIALIQKQTECMDFSDALIIEKLDLVLGREVMAIVHWPRTCNTVKRRQYPNEVCQDLPLRLVFAIAREAVRVNAVLVTVQPHPRVPGGCLPFNQWGGESDLGGRPPEVQGPDGLRTVWTHPGVPQILLHGDIGGQRR